MAQDQTQNQAQVAKRLRKYQQWLNSPVEREFMIVGVNDEGVSSSMGKSTARVAVDIFDASWQDSPLAYYIGLLERQPDGTWKEVHRHG